MTTTQVRTDASDADGARTVSNGPIHAQRPGLLPSNQGEASAVTPRRGMGWAAGKTAASDPGVTRSAAGRRRNAALRQLMAGNVRALRHGVFAVHAVRQDVLDEAGLLYARAPWLDPVRDGHLVEATARLVVRLRKLDQALEGDVSATTVLLYPRLEMQLAHNLEQLGLTPRSAAALGLVQLDAKERATRMAEQGLARYRRPE